MRIAQLVSLQESVPPQGKNGLEHMVSYLTEELVRRGHEVTLFATHDSVTSARLVEMLPYPRSRGVLFDMTTTHYAMSVAAKAAEMSGEFDVIHSHLGAPAYYFADLALAPIVETVHSAASFILHGEEDDALAKYALDRKRRLQHMHHVFVSRNQEKNSGLSERTSVIYNGISFRDFTFHPDGGDYYAYLGYITPEKGAHLAVQAALAAGVKLKLAGSYFGCEEYFAKEIEPYLDSERIEYAGVLDPSERNRFLGGAKALLFPIQWEEPFGLVMIEAMACGTPVIGFRRASVPEVIKDGESGFVVDDSAGMRSAIGRIDKIDRADCRHHVEEHFSVERMADEYEKIYEKAIMERARR